VKSLLNFAEDLWQKVMKSERLFTARFELLFYACLTAQLAVSSFLDPGIMIFGVLCAFVGLNFLKTLVRSQDFNNHHLSSASASTMIAGEIFTTSTNEEEEDERAMRVGGFSKIIKRRIFLSIALAILSALAFKFKLQPALLVGTCLAMVGMLGLAHRRAMLVIPQLIHLMMGFLHIDHWLTLGIFLLVSLPVFLLFCRSLNSVESEDSYFLQFQKIFKDYVLICLLGSIVHLILPMQIKSYVPKSALAKMCYRTSLKAKNKLSGRTSLSRQSFQVGQEQLTALKGDIASVTRLLQQLQLPVSNKFNQQDSITGMEELEGSVENLNQVLKNLESSFESLDENEKKQTAAAIQLQLDSLKMDYQELSGELTKSDLPVTPQLQQLEQSISAAVTNNPILKDHVPKIEKKEKEWWEKIKFEHVKKTLLVIFLYFLLQALFGGRKKEEDLPFGADRRKISQLKSQMASIFSSKMAMEQKIVESFNLWRELTKELHFTQEEVPPSDIMAIRLKGSFPKLAPDFQLVVRNFNAVLYGERKIDAKIYKKYRLAFESILRRTFVKN
jgi:hypothetical protein